MKILDMDEFIKLLHPGPDYISHVMIGDTIAIWVACNREEAVCPYCGCTSTKKHSTYERCFRDIPIMGMKSRIIISNRKMYCTNSECSHAAFAETFSFIKPKAKNKRLLERIVDVSLSVSSLNASHI